MWADDELVRLRDRISAMSDEELLDIVEVNFNDYRKEALDFARAELTARGIEFQEPSEAAGEVGKVASEDAGLAEAEPKREVACARCGGKCRDGVLYSGREITMLFTGSDEQRFVNVYACGKCGFVQMFVDYETEVAEG